jgi:hypothetical protein
MQSLPTAERVNFRQWYRDAAILSLRLGDTEGRAYYLGVARGVRRAHVPSSAIDAYYADAISGDYDHALQTTMRYVDVQWGSSNNDDDEEECITCGNPVSDCCCDDEDEEE